MFGAMTLRSRLILLVLMALAGMAVFAFISAQRNYQEYQQAEIVAEVSSLIPELEDLARDLREERGLSVAIAIDGPERFQSRLLTVRSAVDVLLARIEKALGNSDWWETFPGLRDQLEALIDRVHALRAQREQALEPNAVPFTVRRYSAVIDQAQAVMRRINVRTASAEIADLQAANLQLDRLLEQIGTERAAGLKMLLRERQDPVELRGFEEAVNAQPRLLQEFLDFQLSAAFAEPVQRFGAAGAYPALQRGRELIEYQPQKLALLNDLQISLGMGGLVHNFKNFLLRGDASYRDAVYRQHVEASMAIDAILALKGSNAVDRKALADIRQVIDAFEGKLAAIGQGHQRAADLRKIDDAIRVDEKPALQGLRALRKFNADVSPVDWWDAASARYLDLFSVVEALSREIENRLHAKAAAARNAFIFILLLSLVISAIVLALVAAMYTRLIGGVDALVSVMDEVSRTGDPDLRVPVRGNDELARMGRSLQSILEADQTLRDHALKLATGQVVEKLSLRSDRDQLALAMNELADNSAEIARAAVALAEGDYSIQVPLRAEGDQLGAALQKMTQSLRTFREEDELENWIRSGQLAAVNACSGEEDLTALAGAVLEVVTPYVGAQSAVFYAQGQDSEYEQCGHYAFDRRKRDRARVQSGEGLVGQAIRERSLRVISDLPADYFPVGSALGESDARSVLIVPLVADEEVPGAMEFAFFGTVEDRTLELLKRCQESVAIAVLAGRARKELNVALDTSRKQAEALRASEEELQAQAEELRASNEELETKTAELEEQSNKLRASEEELQAQSEELRAANEELEQKATALEEKTRLLDKAKQEVEARAAEVEQASKYKSEFLANMSHELRTPLNSMLILSKDLKDNDDGNLSDEDVECASIIHESGSNLLRLINDILDLSKVEAGKIELHIDDVQPVLLGESLQKRYAPVAREKNLEFLVEMDADVPAIVRTDPMRYEQIITNLISNGLKFTHEGGVYLRFFILDRGGEDGTLLAVSVRDTGIGIGEDKLDKVFRAFEQADGSTSRQYGGTGLGLAISKEMAQLLGGDLVVESVEGKGSTFFLTIPLQIEKAHVRSAPLSESPAMAALRADAQAQTERTKEHTPAAPPARPGPVEGANAPLIEDDRDQIAAGDPCIVIVEDDVPFAKILLAEVRERGLKGLVATDGPAGVELIQRHVPIGVLLDINLPGADGWWVMSQLKKSEDLRQIPVHFLSANDESTRARSVGAIGYFRKPVSREDIRSAIGSIQTLHDDPHRRLLVIEDDPDDLDMVREELESEFVEIEAAYDVESALQKLREQKFHCVVLDLKMPGGGGARFLECAEQEFSNELPPVVVHTGTELDPEMEAVLHRHAASIVTKTSAVGELEDEVALFLHSVRRGAGKDGAIALSQSSDLAGHAVLVVDDDMRNTFSLSRVLRKQGMRVFMAQDGERALKQLHEHADDIEIVLMDIMMPGMDGYQTIGEIRKEPRFRNLPILALTAKAMTGDREKCLRAGANDYLSKPLDTEKLLTMLRTWLS